MTRRDGIWSCGACRPFTAWLGSRYRCYGFSIAGYLCTTARASRAESSASSSRRRSLASLCDARAKCARVHPKVRDCDANVRRFASIAHKFIGSHQHMEITPSLRSESQGSRPNFGTRHHSRRLRLRVGKGPSWIPVGRLPHVGYNWLNVVVARSIYPELKI